MEVDKIDFDGHDINDPKNNPSNPDDKDPKDNPDNPSDKDTKDNPNDEPKDKSNDKDTKDKSDDNPDDNPSTGELAEGTEIEFDGKTYSVDKDGNIVDDKGTIFKEAKDVKEWLASMNVEDSNNKDNTKIEGLDITKIAESIGTTITDENGNPVEFTNDAEGLKSYINGVMELRTKEIQDAAVNKMYNDNPLLKQFIDYVNVTGSPKGFGEMPDRSTIKLDKDNVTQQEYIIRMAAEEFGNKSMSDAYIKYLKDSNGLYDEAKAALANLVQKDKDTRKAYETQAEANRVQQEKETKEYWDSIKAIVDSGIVAGFKIPDTIIKEENGKKITFNRNDFFNYMYKPAYKDENGNLMTGYQRDLNNLNDKDYKERQMLDAYLLFKGATFKDLAQLAVQEEAVRKLKITSQDSSTKKTVKVTPKSNKHADVNDIIF